MKIIIYFCIRELSRKNSICKYTHFRGIYEHLRHHYFDMPRTSNHTGHKKGIRLSGYFYNFVIRRHLAGMQIRNRSR